MTNSLCHPHIMRKSLQRPLWKLQVFLSRSLPCKDTLGLLTLLFQCSGNSQGPDMTQYFYYLSETNIAEISTSPYLTFKLTWMSNIQTVSVCSAEPHPVLQTRRRMKNKKGIMDTEHSRYLGQCAPYPLCTFSPSPSCLCLFPSLPPRMDFALHLPNCALLGPTMQTQAFIGAEAFTRSSQLMNNE